MRFNSAFKGLRVFDSSTSYLFKIICVFTIIMSFLRIVNMSSDLLFYATFACFVWFIVSQDLSTLPLGSKYTNGSLL
jgi:hypothetical protein